MAAVVRAASFCLLILAAMTVSARAERLPIRTYTTADGLGSSVIIAVVSDSRGFLWFATRNGLSRFDGSEFRTYTTDHGLPNLTVNHLLETKDGEYWVATNGGGVCRFNVEHRADGTPADATPPRLFTCRNVGAQFEQNRVNFLYEDRRHRIWVGTDNGMFQLVRSEGTWRIEPFTQDRLPAGTRFAAHRVFEDSDGRLWVGSGAGLLRVDPDGRTCLYTLREHETFVVEGIGEHAGAVWLGGRFGLLALRPERQIDTTHRLATRRLDPEHACLTDGIVTVPSGEGATCLTGSGDGLTGGGVRALQQRKAGGLWIGATGGLAYLDGLRLTILATNENLAGATFTTLAEDRDGHLWMGTTAGALKLTLDGLVTYGARDGLGHPRIMGIYEDRSGRIVVVSGEWMINRFDGTRFHVINPRVPAGESYGLSSIGAFLDRTDRWWLITDRGVHYLRAGATLEEAARQRAESTYGVENGLSDNRVVRVFEDSRGDVWIGTRSQQPANLARWTRATGKITPFITASSAGPDYPMAFAEDRRGTLWIGLAGGGLARFADGHFRRLEIDDGPPVEVASLHVDSAGRLWIAGAMGVRRLDDPTADPPRVVRYTTAQGLATNNVRCIAEDGFGRMYLGSSRGIDRLDPSSGRVKHFTLSDGLAGDYVTTALRDRTGAIWFGTTDGVSRLVPSADSTVAPLPVWIGEVRAGGALHRLSELGAAEPGPLTLQPNQNHVQIAFFGVSFGGDPLQYRYRLDGAEREWTGPTDRRVVHYASLAPGRYRFVVEALNADGIASVRPATLAFTVLPAFWQRWWFASLMVLLVSALAYTFHRTRIGRLIELERVRARIAADLHDDIGGSLSRIAIQTEVASRDLVQHDGAAANRLVDIGDTARGMVESLGDVVWSVDPIHDDLASVERRVREYAADVLGAKGVRWTFHGTGDRDRVRLDPAARRDLMLLLKEGVTNVARHADARVASLQLHLAGGTVHAELRDDGCGFDAAALDAQDARRHGLANMRLRARQLGGRLVVESTPGIGTRLLLTVPVSLRRRMNMRLRLAARWQSIRSDARPRTGH